MSRTREERVNDALSQLVDRALPQTEDDPASDDRFYRVLDRVRDIVDNSTNVPAVSADVNHVGDLIKRKIVKVGDTERALVFGNLFSRLLGQPVLSQKWAILYLLFLLGEEKKGGDVGPELRNSIVLPERQILGQGEGNEKGKTQSPAVSQSTSDGDSRRDSRVMDEAFSRPGLSHLPAAQGGEPRRERLSRPPPTARRREQAQVNGDAGGDDARDQMSDVHQTSARPSEATLLRDLTFTLQGVSTTNLSFSSNSILKLPSNLPLPIVSLLHALAEPSLLYKGISAFLESTDGGLVGQSLRAAVGNESRSYLGLVASLESQIRRALADLDTSNPNKGLGKAGVTLKRCVIWTRDATMGLRVMTLMVEESKNRKGGQLISLIHSFASSHGDPFVGAFAERLLAHVTTPFYDMLRLWIYDGELSDPYHEFFVSERQASSTDDALHGGSSGAAMSVWEDKYTLDASMIPSIMPEDFAKKVFLIGKSLNFIRHACGDSAWVETYSKTHSHALSYNDTGDLTSSISSAYKTTMSRLMHLMTYKFHLLSHLTALKNYLLLGRGDFIALLMESLSPSLAKPANSQYRHALTAQLEHAIRASNAQHDSPEVLRRLDARMLELSHGEIGWDVFTLEYKVDAPIDVIVTPHASKQYLKVFNLLWRVKRVEHALGATWRRSMTGARGVLGAVADTMGSDWKAARCAMAEMIHFVNQLQYYILFEVIESSWATLQHKMLGKPDATLDDLIAAHAEYLRSITRKGLLGSGGSSLDFPAQLHELIKVMLAYVEAVDGLYAVSVKEFTRRQQRDARIERRTRAGQWGVTERDDDRNNDDDNSSDDASSTANPTRPRPRRTRDDAESPLPVPPRLLAGADGEANVLTALRQRLTELAENFRARVAGLLGDLAYQPDTDLRFLGVVMNFNETYKVVRRGRGGRREKEREREREKEKEKGRDG